MHVYEQQYSTSILCLKTYSASTQLVGGEGGRKNGAADIIGPAKERTIQLFYVVVFKGYSLSWAN